MRRIFTVIGALGLTAFFLVQSSQAKWTPATRLTWTAGDSMMPAVAVDPADGIHVVWQDDTSGIAEICYKRSLNGGASWSGLQMLTWNAGASEYPAVAADPNNCVHVVWQDNTPGTAEIYYARSEDRGATWSAARRLTWRYGASERPAIAVDSADRIHVVWQGDYPGVTEIYYRQSTDGGTNWGAVRRLTWTSGLSEYPALAVGSGAGIHLLWHDDTPGNQEVFYKRSTDGGTTWNTAKRLTWTSGNCWAPDLAKGAGNALQAVYCSVSDVFTKKSTDGGASWSVAKRLTWDMESTRAVVAVDSINTIHMMWQRDYVYDEADIFYRKSTDGGTTWSTAVDLTSSGGKMNGRSYGPALAIDSSNAVYFVWYDEAWMDNFEIFYRKSI